MTGRLRDAEGVIRGMDDEGQASSSGMLAGELAQRVHEVKALAHDLEGPVQKYPKSGGGSLLEAFSRLQSRYVAVVARPAQGPRSSRTAEGDMQRWRGGCLGWWEAHDEFKRNGRPKGYVMLSKILDVKPSPTESTAVIIEHREQTDRYNLELVFGTPELAKRFHTKLRDLQTKLNSPM